MRMVAAVALTLSFLGTGFGTYMALDRSRANLGPGHAASSGTRARPLPGTVYAAQAGRLYSYRAGVFRQLTAAEGWTEPALTPDGTGLIAIKRAFNFSDIYLLGLDGRVRTQLTHNADSTVELNHWAFFPRFSADGASIFYSYDPKDPYNNFRVDLAVYAMAAGGPGPGRPWTRPNQYTGGDVAGTPLRNGALLYAKYAIDDAGMVHSQLWIQARALSPGAELTPAADDCGQPAVAPDGGHVAMVCRRADGQAVLEVAGLDLAAYTLGARTALVADQDVSSPTFSPDGASLAYFAPTRPGGPLQLWVTSAENAVVPPEVSPAPSPSTPNTPVGGRIQITTDLAFDATAPVAWSR